MYQLLTAVSRTQLFARQAPVLLGSLAIAEVFYKFHSFTLECIGFLATWFVLDAAAQLVARRLGWTWLTRPSR